MLDTHKLAKMPDIVGVGTNKAGTEDFVFIEQYELLSVEVVLSSMESNLLN